VAKNVLPSYELIGNEYHEIVTGFQRYGGVVFGIFIWLISLFFYLKVGFNDAMSIFMITITLVIGVFGFWNAAFIEKKVINPSQKIIIWQAVYSMKTLRSLSFWEISGIRSIDLRHNGDYQGRAFYYHLKNKDNSIAHVENKLCKTFVNAQNQTIFENGIKQLIFSS
jgi:hypothetical protein